jgi:hypothetical protein
MMPMDWREYVRQRPTSPATRRATARSSKSSHSISQLALAIRRADRVRPAAPVPPVVGGRRLVTDLSKDIQYAVRLLQARSEWTRRRGMTLY